MSRMEDDKLMDVEEDNLQSKLDDDVLSCSSSILNTPRQERHGDKDDDVSDLDEDGINVTLCSKPPVDILTTQFRQDKKGTKLNGESMKPLSGAGKKRFKRLIESGVDPEEARRLAILPLLTPNSDSSGDNPRPKKQGRFIGPKQPLQNRLDQHRTEASGQSKGTEGPTRNKPSYRDVANSVKVGILPKNYPNSELTMQQLLATQKAVLNKVVQQRKEKIKPKFGNCLFRPGYLILICKNQETSDWIKDIISSIIPWVGAELIAVNEDQIPQPETLIGFFPMSADDSNEEILALLEGQNDGLVVDSWKIFMRRIINKRHVELTFSVDGTSMRSLEECYFVLDYKFGNAPIRKKIPKKIEMEVDQNSEADSITKPCDTGDDKVCENITYQQVPGPSGVKNTARTPHPANEANSIFTRTCDITGDDLVGGKTTNKNVPGLNSVQNTERTLLKPEYRNISFAAGNNQLMNDCQDFAGERKDEPKEQIPDRPIQ